MELVAYAYPLESTDRECLSRTLIFEAAPALVLHTCQRLEVYARPDWRVPVSPVAPVLLRGEAAILRLARIATGLDSRILGELEIMGQVRKAYKNLAALGGERDLLRTLEWIVAVARKARRESGIDRHLISLGGLASHHLLERVQGGLPIAVIGSGDLARSCVRTLSKRGNAPVRVASRCPQNALALAAEFGAFSDGLDQLTDLLNGVGGILCATAAPHPILFHEHLKSATATLQVVDLGVPPDCSLQVQGRLAERYTSLKAIEGLVAGNRAERRRCADLAEQVLLRELAKRSRSAGLRQRLLS